MADSYAHNDEPLYDQSPGQYLHVEPDEVVPANFDNPLYFETRRNDSSKDTGYLAVQPDWLNEQWDLLAAQPWFRGFQTREDAFEELQGQSPGTFVVRVSNSEPGHYAISAVQHHGKMDHMLILPSYAGNDSTAPGNTRYRLGTYSKDLFNTVPKLIAYYIDHEYIDVRRLQGVVIPESQAGGYMDVNPNAPTMAQWKVGKMSRAGAESKLSGQPVGGFVLRTKPGQGYVLSMVVDPPKHFMHHLITVEQGEYLIDGQPVGPHRSVDALVEFLQQDTLGCINCELIDVFGGDDNFDGGSGYPAGNGDPVYDSAGGVTEGHTGGGLYDAVPADGGGHEAVYDEASTDGVAGYLGVEPAAYSDEVGDYGDYDASGYAPQEPAYSDHPAYDDEPVYGDDAIDTYGAAGGNGKPYNPYDDNDDDVL